MRIRRRVSTINIYLQILIIFSFIGVGCPIVTAKALGAQPWTSAQATAPSKLAAMLADKSKPKPIILQVGFETLYRSKHIPGSIYAGPGTSAEGLAKLKQAVAKLPKTSDIYIYCGCCPLTECPNIRPAFQALRSMGYSHLHVLILNTNFGKDWVAHGYPVVSN